MSMKRIKRLAVTLVGCFALVAAAVAFSPSESHALVCNDGCEVAGCAGFSYEVCNYEYCCDEEDLPCDRQEATIYRCEGEPYPWPEEE